MKTKRVLFIAIIGIIMTGFQLNAQPQERFIGPPPPDSIHIQKMIEEMGKELALSSEQKTEISAIFFNEMKTQKKKQDEIKAKRILEREQTHKEINEKVKSLLTEDQALAFVLFEENHKPECPPKAPKHHNDQR